MIRLGSVKYVIAELNEEYFAMIGFGLGWYKIEPMMCNFVDFDWEFGPQKIH